METCLRSIDEKVGAGRIHAPARMLASQPALLQWITPQELEELRAALARGGLPPDFLGKLKRMIDGDLTHHFIKRNCHLFSALLMERANGGFREGGSLECERLLRVLAYVRKDDDAIPDYKPEGFTDDQREIRAASIELDGLIQRFKAWRLRHQVPVMWKDRGFSGRPLRC
jgi:hypothetical protein